MVAVVCLPMLKRGLGTERLGIMSLAWVLIGYFSLFDLGLSRALTKLVAERIAQRRQSEVASLVWTSLSLMTAVGIVGALLTFLLAPYLVERLLKVPASLSHEALGSFYWLGAAVPVVVLTAGLRGVLEAVQHFRLATAIRVPMGIFTYLGPAALLPFTHSLIPIIAVLVLGRILPALPISGLASMYCPVYVAASDFMPFRQAFVSLWRLDDSEQRAGTADGHL